MNLKFFRLYGLTMVVSLFIMYTCMMPSTPDAGSFLALLPEWLATNFDKVVHFIYFFALSVAAGSDFYRQRTDYGTKKMIFWTILYPIMLGGLIEIMQANLTTTRSGDCMDFLFDSLGAVTGYFVGKMLVPRYIQRELGGIK